MAQADLVIRGATIIDGSGAASFTGDIAIKDGVFTAVGDVTGSAREEINAHGAMAIPGLVDIHTHYDGLCTWAERMQPSSHHGVTTAVMGNCGVGFAPVRTEDHNRLIELMEGVEDIPGVALHEGLPWAWESFPDYLNYLDARPFDMDIAAQLPHAALRVYVMGERGAAREEATADDIASMRRLTAEAIAAGALGFTSSRTLNHRSINGDPTPSLTAAKAELIGIAAGVRDAGGAVIEMISDFKGLDEEFETLMAMVDAANSPMSMSLAQGLNPNGWRKIISKIEAANASGRVVRGQVAPRAIGITLGLSASRNPFSSCPSYRTISDLPLPARVEKLRDPAFRAQLIGEAESAFSEQSFFDQLWCIDANWDYEPDPAHALGAIARQKGTSPVVETLDAMLNLDGAQLLYRPFANYLDNNLDCCREMILHPNTVMGLGDGGAHVGIICDASFPSYLLTHWGRDRSRGERIDLPTLVKAQTQDTAQAVGLNDRGMIRAGLKADLNLIDFSKMRLEAPYMVNDLPLGGARLEQKCRGILRTIVSGQTTYIDGAPTDQLPGRLIRRGR
jgi:N-acyl-D-aspartate/D-glutamate deacylase